MLNFIKEKFKTIKQIREINYNLIPTNELNSIEEFNEIIKKLNDLNNKNLINRGIERTKSGGIKIKPYYMYNYSVEFYGWCAEILIVSEICTRLKYTFRVFLNKDDEKETISGRQAYNILKRELKKDGVEIENYFIENGSEIKQEIEKPLIRLSNEFIKDSIFYNVQHFDINSSYPFGISEFCEDFKTTIERLYKLRKTNPIYKQVLNLSCGFFQSKLINFRMAHFSKFAIKLNNDRIKKIANFLEENGREILAFNTDGVWFVGNVPTREEIETIGEKLGNDLGNFKIDHENCKIRFKSAGAYEFIENGVYNAVVRGHTKLDDIKPRSEWEWGDIYQKNAEIQEFEISTNLNDNDYGIIKKIDNERMC